MNLTLECHVHKRDGHDHLVSGYGKVYWARMGSRTGHWRHPRKFLGATRKPHGGRSSRAEVPRRGVPAGPSPRLLWRASRHGCCGASRLSHIRARRNPRAAPATPPEACPRVHRGRREWHQRGGRGRGGDKRLCCGEAASAAAPRERPVQGRGERGRAVGGGGWGACGRGVSAAARPRSIISGRVGGGGRPYGRVRRGWQPAAVPCRPQPRRRASL